MNPFYRIQGWKRLRWMRRQYRRGLRIFAECEPDSSAQLEMARRLYRLDQIINEATEQFRTTGRVGA